MGVGGNNAVGGQLSIELYVLLLLLSFLQVAVRTNRDSVGQEITLP